MYVICMCIYTHTFFILDWCNPKMVNRIIPKAFFQVVNKMIHHGEIQSFTQCPHPREDLPI